MIQDVKDFVSQYCAVDEPVPYNGLLIYPWIVKDFYRFGTSWDILTIKKNEIPDVKIIQMSYLEFILSVMCNNYVEYENTGRTIGSIYLEKLENILCLSFHVNVDEISVKYDKNRYSLIIKGIEISSKQFDEIIKIILFQNIYDYFDDYIDPEFKKAIDEYYAIKNKGIIVPDLEKKITVVTASTGIVKSELLKMTYREFENLFHTVLDMVDYKILKQAESSGMVKFDKPVEHWVYKQEKNRYEEAFTSYDGLKNKIEKSVGG